MLVASTAPNNTAEPNPSFTQQVAVAQTSSTATTNGENIKVFGRIRPENSVKNIGYSNTSKRQTFQYTLDKPSETDDSNKDPQLHITLFKDETQGLVNNSRERFDFSFTKVFDQHTTQEEVFDNVAKGVVDSVLDGYNGTLFAYGQVRS